MSSLHFLGAPRIPSLMPPLWESPFLSACCYMHLTPSLTAIDVPFSSFRGEILSSVDRVPAVPGQPARRGALHKVSTQSVWHK